MRENPKVDDAAGFAAELEQTKVRFNELLSKLRSTMPEVVSECDELTKALKRIVAAIEESDEAIRLADFLLCHLD